MSIARSIARPLLLLLLVGAAGSVLATEVYRWKDANGVTHYGPNPPEGGEAERVAVRRAPPPPEAAAETSSQEPSEEASESSSDPVASANERAEAARKAAIEAAAEARRIARESACARAQQNLRVLRANDFVSLRDGDQTRTLTAEERQQQISENETVQTEKCGPESPAGG